MSFLAYTCSAVRVAFLGAAGIYLSLFSSVGFARGFEQTTALFPTSRAALPGFARPSPLAEQASAAFAPLPALKGGAALQTIRRSSSLGFDAETTVARVQPVCGQAPDVNTLACYNMAKGELLADVPIPGQLTTTPQFFDGSWFVGTSRGFFIRLDANNGVYSTPSFSVGSLFFHGPDARQMMRALSSVPSTEPTAQSSLSRFRVGWNWFATANAEFVGTPQFGGGRVFALTANQSLNAYDLQTGKLAWGVRLAPEVQLRLSSTSLVLHERGLLVGTSDGHLLLLDPKTGQSLWRQAINGGLNDRFPSVSASVLALNDGIIVSNAESVTQRLSWESRSSEWTYNVGSVVQPKYDEGSVFLAGSDGAVHKLDARTGQLRWKSSLPVTSPLVALTILKKQDIAFAATADGLLFAINILDGSVVQRAPTSSFGPVVGDFFNGRSELNEVCLSYRTPGYACWTWNSAQRTANHGK